jgi:hypothetical protein
MKRISILATLLVLFMSITVHGQFSKDILIGDLIANYTCSQKGSIISSKFIVKTDSKTLYETTYDLDTSQLHYKLLQSKSFAQYAQSSIYKDDFENLNKANDLIENLLVEIFKVDKVDRVLVQSIFFHRAFIKHNLRMANTGDNTFLAHPGYFIDKTYFFDQRDYYVKKAVILRVINSHPEFQKDTNTIALQEYLTSHQQEELTFDKFYGFYVTAKQLNETIDNILTNRNKNMPNESEKRACAWWCPLGCGSDWGCCGNYSGCCLYRNLICLVHDAGCSYTECKPRWLCFSGCVPD